MFTTLNLTVTSQLSQETSVLQAENVEGLALDDTSTFAASLDQSMGQSSDDSLQGRALSGNPLPLAGMELPIEGEDVLDTGMFLSDEQLNSTEGLTPEQPLTVRTFEWPPGLQPNLAENVESGPKPTAPEEGEVFATAAADGQTLLSGSPTSAMAAPTSAEALRMAATSGETAALASQAAATVARPGAKATSMGDASTSIDLELTADGETEPGIRELVRAESRGDRMPPEAVGLRPAPSASSEVLPERLAPSLDNGLRASSAFAENSASQAFNVSATAQRAAPNLVNTGANPGVASTLPGIATPVGDPGWGDSVADRVLLMANSRLGNAEIRLTPAELGPVRVQVSVEDGATNVAFQATQAATREALEQALPRLRDMLAENGLSLGQASVGDQGVRDGGRDASASSSVADSANGEAELDSADDQGGQSARSRVSNGLVDTFV